MGEIKFDLAMKNINFSVSFMLRLLFTIIELLPILRLSCKNLCQFGIVQHV